MSVLILGGGPAGSAAALTLLAAGIEVTVLEQSRFPRYRPGETLHPGIEPLLDRLGALQPILDAHYLRHTGHFVEWGGERRFVPYGEDSREPWRGFQALRGDFDQHLLSTAIRNGAVVIFGHPPVRTRTEHDRVTGVDTAQGSIHARFTIDGTGASGWLSRQLGIRSERCSPRLVARFGYVRPHSADSLREPLIRADSQGWTWISEVQPGRVHWTRVTRLHDRPPKRWVPDALRESTAEPSRGADVTWRIARRTAGPGWFLTGDAAAVLDPSSSHGVVRAIMTGMMAGSLVAKTFRNEATEAECTRAYHDWISAWFAHDAARMTEAYRQVRLFGLAKGVMSDRHSPRDICSSSA